MARGDKLKSKGRDLLEFPSVDNGLLAEFEVVATRDLASNSLTLRMGGRTGMWHFDGYPRPSLAHDVVQVFEAMCNGGRYNTFDRMYGDRLSLGGFLSNIESLDRGGSLLRLKDIDLAFIETLDGPNLTTGAWTRLGILLRLLRYARDHGVAEVNQCFSAGPGASRLSHTSRFAKPKNRPRPPYSSFERDQLKDAARCDMADALRKFRSSSEGLDGGFGERAEFRICITDLKVLARLQYPGALQELERRSSDRSEHAANERPSVSSERLREIARARVRGHSPTKLAANYGIPVQQLRNLERADGAFQAALRTSADEFIIEVLRDKSDSQNHCSAQDRTDAAIKAHEAENKYAPGSLHEQIERRLRILSLWSESDVPPHVLQTLDFNKSAIANWTDRALGITAIRCTFRDFPHLRKVIVSLRKRYTHRSEIHSQLITRISAIETALSAPDTFEDYGLRTFDLNSILSWNLPALHIRPIGRVQFFTERYAPLKCRLEVLCQAANAATHFINFRQQEEALPSVELFPRQDDLLPFLLHLAMMVELDYSSIKSLRSDCLQNPSNGYVDLVYKKGRAGNKYMSKRVEDGSFETPGGTIRAILAMTQAARRALARTESITQHRLWIGRFRLRLQACTFFHSQRNPWALFASRHDLSHDDGSPMLVIQPSRFRKTLKIERYTRFNGRISALTDDHSFAVARDYYADNEVIEHIHDRAVGEGLKEALFDARRRVVVGSADPLDEVNRISQITGRSVEACAQAIEGVSDTWLASCLNFTDSPFAKRGRPCPSAFTECILCENAVFSARKLPNLLAYRKILKEWRSTASPTEWAAGGSRILSVLEEAIISQFSASDLAAAEASNSTPFIPFELRRAR